MNKDHISSILLTTSINISPNKIKGDINKLLLFILKQKYEGSCNKDGYIIKDSIQLINRSIGQIRTINNKSITNYNVTYKSDIIIPSENEQFTCYVETINKLGIIAYIRLHKDDTMADSPFIIIIPNEYINDKDKLNSISINDKITIKIKSFRIKYLAKQIQIVATLV